MTQDAPAAWADEAPPAEYIEKDAGVHDSSSSNISGFEDSEHTPVRNVGFVRACVNVVCVIIGSGCLQIPYALAKTGWIGILYLVISTMIAMYTGNLIIKALYYKSGRRLYSAPEVGRHAFGVVGQFAAQFFNYLYTLGTTCLYIILAGQFLHQLVEPHGVTFDKRIWMVIVAVIVWIPIAVFKFLTEAAVLALFGFLTSCIVILVGTIQSLRFPHSKQSPDDPPVHYDAALGSGIPVAISSILFSFAGSVIYPHVESAMKRPKQWPKVMVVAMSFCAIAYLLIGICGYWAYGDAVQSPLLNSIPNDNANKATVAMVTIHVILAAPILIMSFFSEIEKQWGIDVARMGKRKELLIRLGYRSLVMCVVCGISVAIPYFSDFLALIGALSTTMMMAVIPVVCYIKLFGWRSVPWYELVWMAIVVVIGLVGCVWGTIDAVKSLVHDVQNDVDY